MLAAFEPGTLVTITTMQVVESYMRITVALDAPKCDRSDLDKMIGAALTLLRGSSYAARPLHAGLQVFICAAPNYMEHDLGIVEPAGLDPIDRAEFWSDVAMDCWGPVDEALDLFREYFIIAIQNAEEGFDDAGITGYDAAHDRADLERLMAHLRSLDVDALTEGSLPARPPVAQEIVNKAREEYLEWRAANILEPDRSD
ncbi:MAG: hypothetical protein KC983_06920 [Phycisphaerales bacterium]|nr:hypothetical protein [Phycisphaerales bacterium]